jgi:Rrf2 family transcriptional regulator, cysteine metabolism repressor
MVQLSQKCRYAIRATLDLARRGLGQSATIAEIAEAQQIPASFLAIILTDLRRDGILQSRRGTRGGYYLNADPRKLSVLRVILCVEGKTAQGQDSHPTTPRDDYVWGDGVIEQLYERATASVERVFASTTFEKLIEQETLNNQMPTANYCI